MPSAVQENELERRPIEERERLTRESNERAPLRVAWERLFPWFPLAELGSVAAEFLNRLPEVREPVVELRREGIEAVPWVSKELGPHVIRWASE